MQPSRPASFGICCSREGGRFPSRASPLPFMLMMREYRINRDEGQGRHPRCGRAPDLPHIPYRSDGGEPMQLSRPASFGICCSREGRRFPSRASPLPFMLMMREYRINRDEGQGRHPRCGRAPDLPHIPYRSDGGEPMQLSRPASFGICCSREGRRFPSRASPLPFMLMMREYRINRDEGQGRHPRCGRAPDLPHVPYRSDGGEPMQLTRLRRAADLDRLGGMRFGRAVCLVERPSPLTRTLAGTGRLWVRPCERRGFLRQSGAE